MGMDIKRLSLSLTFKFGASFCLAPSQSHCWRYVPCSLSVQANEQEKTRSPVQVFSRLGTPFPSLSPGLLDHTPPGTIPTRTILTPTAPRPSLCQPPNITAEVQLQSLLNFDPYTIFVSREQQPNSPSGPRKRTQKTQKTSQWPATNPPSALPSPNRPSKPASSPSSAPSSSSGRKALRPPFSSSSEEPRCCWACFWHLPSSLTFQQRRRRQ
ncbi:hypothetical protein QBC39DRAFT_95035 [Podospora conica]|nr:hypothetical protein QBC39DRAFT_95035 [Schizothecium conicum]